ncbi:MAG: DUF192 domain-containing protein [Candidatus Woesearchaeota archaeon]
MEYIKAFFLFIMLFLLGCGANNPMACINEYCFNVEIVDQPLDQSIGLMQHDYLAEQDGMLFVYETLANRPFWMYNMSFSIDIIWINQNLEVVSIVENAQPCHNQDCKIYDPNVNSQYVLEINSGMVDFLNIKKGDMFIFKNI